MKIALSKDEVGSQWIEHCIQILRSHYGVSTSHSENEPLFTESFAKGSCYYRLEPGLDLIFLNKLSFCQNIFPEREATSQTEYYTLQINYDNETTKDTATLKTKPNIYWTSSNTVTCVQVEKSKTVETVIINVSAKYLQQHNVQPAQLKLCKSQNLYDNLNIQEFYDLRKILHRKNRNIMIQRLELNGIVLQLLARFLAAEVIGKT